MHRRSFGVWCLAFKTNLNPCTTARDWAVPGLDGGEASADVAVFGLWTPAFTQPSLVPEADRFHTGGVANASAINEFVPLPRAFYEPSAHVVARELLGHWLVRNTPQGPAGGLIVETEAYLADDAACHATSGLTQRNRVMFGPPGHAYVYLIYGYHFCFNAVCQPQGTAEAVLIRAVEATAGRPFLLRRRPVSDERDLTSGPAKLCEAMGIDRTLDGADLCDPRSELVIAQNPQSKAFREARGPLVTTVRIGITRAAELPLRFYLDGSLFVSRRVRVNAGQRRSHRP